MALALKESSNNNLTVTEAMVIIRRHQDAAPVKVSAIAKDMGIAVFTYPLEEGISGKIFRDDKSGSPSGWVIFVNDDEPSVRQRFTVAHEVAHFILHRDKIGGELADDVFYRSKLSSPLEREANDMAADILMPWHLIAQLQSEGVTTVESLADRLQVSAVALSIRLGMPT